MVICGRDGRMPQSNKNDKNGVMHLDKETPIQAVSASAGAGPRAKSVSMVAGLPCVARGFATTTAMSSRLDRGAGRGLAWPLGHEPDADQHLDAQARSC